MAAKKKQDDQKINSPYPFHNHSHCSHAPLEKPSKKQFKWPVKLAWLAFFRSFALPRLRALGTLKGNARIFP
jgi:hypothetical protein